MTWSSPSSLAAPPRGFARDRAGRRACPDRAASGGGAFGEQQCSGAVGRGGGGEVGSDGVRSGARRGNACVAGQRGGDGGRAGVRRAGAVGGSGARHGRAAARSASGGAARWVGRGGPYRFGSLPGGCGDAVAAVGGGWRRT